MENLTFTDLKEIAKVISIDDERVERLYIEQLENQSLSLIHISEPTRPY